VPDDDDAQDQEVVGVQDLVQQTSDQVGLVHELSEEASSAASEVRRQGTSARERAAVAKQRELAAHQRAIELQERPAELQERLGHPDRAANAHQHAEHARELLPVARAAGRAGAIAADRHGQGGLWEEDQRVDGLPAELRERLAVTAERVARTFAFEAQVRAGMATHRGAGEDYHRSRAAWNQTVADFERRQAEALRGGRLLGDPMAPSARSRRLQATGARPAVELLPIRHIGGCVQAA
jgi:hypothetical protein